MFAMIRRRLPIVVIVGVAFAALLALATFSSADAAEQDGATKEKTDAAKKTEGTAQEGPITIENHSWENYHWARTANPLSLKLGDNVSSDWDSYLQTASSHATLNDWSDSNVVDTAVVAGQTKPRQCRATSERVEVCNAKYGYTGWSGLAQIWISGDHITAGVAKMNDTYIKSDDVYKKHHVMCQEIGHTFGLGHQDESGANLGTCMDYSNTASEDGKYPNQHDYDQLETIYSHLESTTTSKMPAAASRGNFNARAEWGKLKHTSSDGKHKVYEREFSDGKLVTFVEVEDEEILEDQEDQPQQKKQEK